MAGVLLVDRYSRELEKIKENFYQARLPYLLSCNFRICAFISGLVVVELEIGPWDFALLVE